MKAGRLFQRNLGSRYTPARGAGSTPDPRTKRVFSRLPALLRLSPPTTGTSMVACARSFRVRPSWSEGKRTRRSSYRLAEVPLSATRAEAITDWMASSSWSRCLLTHSALASATWKRLPRRCSPAGAGRPVSASTFGACDELQSRAQPALHRTLRKCAPGCACDRILLCGLRNNDKKIGLQIEFPSEK